MIVVLTIIKRQWTSYVKMGNNASQPGKCSQHTVSSEEVSLVDTIDL